MFSGLASIQDLLKKDIVTKIMLQQCHNGHEITNAAADNAQQHTEAFRAA